MNTNFGILRTKRAIRLSILFCLIIGIKISYAQDYCLKFSDLLIAQPDSNCKFIISGLPVSLQGSQMAGLYCSFGYERFQICASLTNDLIHPTCSNGGTAPPMPIPGIMMSIKKEDFPDYQHIDSLIITVLQSSPTAPPFSSSDATGPLVVYPDEVDGSLGPGNFPNGSHYVIRNFQQTDSIRLFYYTQPNEGYPGTSQLLSDPLNPEIVNIHPVYKTSSCHDADINIIESMLGNALLRERIDFHEYYDTTVICDPLHPQGSHACTMEGVWDFIKTKAYYQVPSYNDFPASTAAFCLPDINIVNQPYTPIINAFLSAYRNEAISNSSNLNTAIDNCSEVFLAPTPARILAGSMINFFSARYNPVSLVSLPLGCSGNIYTEPVKLVIDERNKRITNYTLQGHFLFPGKVVRTVISDGCKKPIMVVTHGIGFTTCGNNWAGELIAYINKCTGRYTFKKVSERLNNDFNQ